MRPSPAAAPPSAAHTPGWPFLGLLRMAYASGRLAESIPILVDAAELASPAPGAAAQPAAAGRPTAVISDGADAPVLICLPSFLAGSGPHQFIQFAAELPLRRRTLGISLPGYAAGTAVPSSWDGLIDALVAGTAEAADGQPFVIVGYSVGGVLAYDVATTLCHRGVAPEGLVMLDTFQPRATPERAFAWAMGQILNRDHAFLSLDDEQVAIMARYMRLLGERSPSDATVPGLLVQASASAQLDWPHWRVTSDCVEVQADHFSLLEACAAQTSAAVDRWLTAVTDRAPAARADAP